MENLKEFAEKLANLTVLEAHKLAEIMKEQYGIEPAGPEIINPVVEEKVEEVQTEFDVILQHFGPKKLQVVKVVKEILGKPLKESKELVDSVPSVLVEKVTEIEASTLRDKLVAVGAEVDVK